MEDLDEEARRAERAPAFGPLLAVGLITYGGVHVVIAWLFVQVTWHLDTAHSNRPIMAMSRTGIGQAALWLTGAGMAILVAWRVIQVVSDKDRRHGASRFAHAATRLFEAAIYILIAISAVEAALTRGRQGSAQGEGRQEQSLGAVMLQHLWSRILLGAIAVALFALGAQLFKSAVTHAFAHDLADDAPASAVAIGAIGTFVKGLAVVIVSVLIGWAVVTFDPSKTAGIEAMIETLRRPLLGQLLLTVIAAGLACYGVYCFVWSLHPRRS